MPVDFSAREDLSPPDPDASAFAPTPVYARPTKKSRRFRSAAPSVTTAMAGPAGETVLTRGPLSRDDVADDVEGRARAPARRMPAAALLALPVALVALGGAYYWMQTRDTGAPLAANTAAAPAVLSTTPAVETPVVPPVETMPTPTPMPPAATTPRAERAATPAVAAHHAQTRVARARPTPAPTADDSAADASAVVPASPPTAVNPRTDVAPPMAMAPPPLTPPPVSGAVNPAPVTPPPGVTGATPGSSADGTGATP
ncbi:hypothetical protein [Phenylobacterium sp.]|uniref:hypothetical protein n=1 Tax=Phenylobacterium sp. TaxID=1871053 RepID=UPI002F412F72